MHQQQQLAIQRVHDEEEAAARTLERQSKHENNRAEYRDQLERKRMIDQINAQRQLQDEERSKAEESLRRQEAIRRKTLEYEAELRQNTEIARVKAEAIGRIQQERENHDLTLEKKRLELSEYRETILQAISSASHTLGNGIQDFITDRNKLTNTTITLTAIAFGLYTAKTSIGITGRFIESRLGKPTLVRETSRINPFQFLASPIKSFRHTFTSSTFLFRNNHSALDKVVLEPSLEKRLKRIAISTVNTKVNKAPYRHLLFHGAPGTGKTMFAKGLAKDSGMHYAIITGGDIAPLGRDAVTEIHKLFDWANSTNKGVVIFIDEADAFLRKRSTEKISEDMRNALNAFLYRTGEASKKFMIVYASNQPDQFDWAINDRIDELIEFKLPSYNERLRMITQYLEDYILNVKTGSRPITATGIDEILIKSISKQTEGFSGREISKLAIAWQAAAYGNANAVIDENIVQSVLEDMKASKFQKQKWFDKDHLTNMNS